MDTQRITQPSEAEDKTRIKAVLDKIALPAEITDVTIDLRDDASGEPAVYLSFRVDQAVRLEEKDIARLSRYLAQVSFAVLDSGIARFPYTDLNQAA